VLEIPFPEGPGVRTISVISIIQKRVAAAEARVCYEELTTPDVFEVQKNWHITRLENPGGRPTKKDRRDIDKIHGFWDSI
jgi:ribosome-associated heat shock protein Hsp15